MKMADKACLVFFFTYLIIVLLYGLYATFLAFLAGDMAILDPYEGRAEMYLDGFHE